MSVSAERQGTSCLGFLLWLLVLIVGLPLVCWGAYRVIMHFEDSSAYTQPLDGDLLECSGNCSEMARRVHVRFTYEWEGRTWVARRPINPQALGLHLCIRPDRPEKYVVRANAEVKCGTRNSGVGGTAKLWVKPEGEHDKIQVPTEGFR